jgi:hypothetical protein
MRLQDDLLVLEILLDTVTLEKVLGVHLGSSLSRVASVSLDIYRAAGPILGLLREAIHVILEVCRHLPGMLGLRAWRH